MSILKYTSKWVRVQISFKIIVNKKVHRFIKYIKILMIMIMIETKAVKEALKHKTIIFSCSCRKLNANLMILSLHRLKSK
jgi:hypothetical protein